MVAASANLAVRGFATGRSEVRGDAPPPPAIGRGAVTQELDFGGGRDSTGGRQLRSGNFWQLKKMQNYCLLSALCPSFVS